MLTNMVIINLVDTRKSVDVPVFLNSVIQLLPTWAK